MEDDIMSLLSEMYDEVVEEEAKELGIDVEKTGYEIKDENQANFFLRRMEEVNKEKAEINDMCDKEIEMFVNRVNSFRNKKLVSLDTTTTYFTQLLEKYAQNALMESKKKSIKLIFGTLQFKKAADKYEYEDDKIIKFIDDNQLVGLTRTKVELNKADLKKAITVVDGNVLLEGKPLEGLTITPGGTNFSIKL